MKNNNALFAIVGIAIGVFGMGGWNAMMSQPQTRSMMDTQRSATNTQIDAHYIEQMVPHHEDAITMAEIALQKAQKPEVKLLAANIIKSQSAEINTMKEWYKNWFNRELPTDAAVMDQHVMPGMGIGMHMGIMGDESDIASLIASEDFDRSFVEQMIPHHQMAIMMTNMLRNGTARPEMQKLATEIITAQSSEIETMRAWLVAWQK